MSSDHIERRLAAILAADVVGSCRLIGIDEEGTLARLKALRRTLFDPKIAEHHGRVVKNTGDGAIAEFASVLDAVRCAEEIQRGMAEQNIDVAQDKRIELRIGIHIGDIIIEENDIFGDGVNIAVRLEGIAESGGISISDDTYRQIRGKVDIAFEDMGPQNLKNITEPMRMWRRRTSANAFAAASIKPPVETIQALALPDKPSIAVLPFQNMSSDPEQEYFADGVVEDIITALSRFKALFVIARNSSFTYKGHAVDVKRVGRELGVRYVLEGSVRRAANRVRITGQLVDTATGAHLWVNRIDGGLGDIFDLQDQVTESVVGAIAPAVEKAEIERARRKPTESLDAYDHYLRAMAAVYQWTRESHTEALRLFNKATEIDPDFAAAYGMAARSYVLRATNGWMTDKEREVSEAMRLARRAADLGRDDAIALCMAGFAIARIGGDLKAGADLIDQAIVLNPNLAAASLFAGWVRVWLGEANEAINRFAHAMRLSPIDPQMFNMQAGTAGGHFIAGRYEEARTWAERAMSGQSNFGPALRIAAASQALTGRFEDARKAVALLRLADPDLRISNLKDRAPWDRDGLARLAEGLRKAGLPD